MAATFEYFPFDAGAGAESTEQRWGEMMKYMRTTGILAASTTLSAVGDSAVAPDVGMQIQVYDGKCWNQGFMFIHTGDPYPIVISPNSSGDSRIDLVVIKLDKPFDIISYAVIEGTPDPSPVAPTPQQDDDVWEFPLAEIEVADGAVTIGAMDITDVRVRSVQGNAGSSPLVAGAGITLIYSGDTITITSP